MRLIKPETDYEKTQVLLGAHFSIAGGLENALKDAMVYGCNTCQIFTKNANTWRERQLSAHEIERFIAAKKRSRVTKIASHTSYLINPATPDMAHHKKSCDALTQEIKRAHALGVHYVVLHPGSHKGSGEQAGIGQITAGLRKVLSRTSNAHPMILLETTAGQGDQLGFRFEQIAEMLDRIGHGSRMGVCLDTSHIFAAGYDIRSALTYGRTIERFDAVIGLNRLKMLHLNDSKKELGTRVDRHAHIGEGCLGLAAFRFIMNDAKLQKIPKVIETPKDKGNTDWDAINLQRLRSLVSKG